jgi:chromosome segregation ATPase
MAFMVLLTPAAAFAQVSYSQARIEPPPRLHVCADQQVSLADRKAYLDTDKAELDRERDAIAREGARLADGIRSLDNTNTAAVAAYNARSADHNRHVESYNGRVAEMNRAAALLTGDSADFNAYCNTLRFSRR